MNVIPAAPHYQGRWHQGQLRLAKWSVPLKWPRGLSISIALTGTINSEIHGKLKFSLIIIILSGFLQERFQKMCALVLYLHDSCMLIVQFAIECIFKLGHSSLSGNYGKRHVKLLLLILWKIFLFLRRSSSEPCTVIFLICALPPDLIRLSNIKI